MDFYSVYERYYSRVRSFILTIVKDEWVADDLVQETFTRVITHKSEIRDTNSLSTWIFRIAYNLCQDYFRSHAKKNFETNRNPDAAPAMAALHQRLEQSQMSACVQTHMQRLSEPLLAVLILYDMFGFKQAEIANIIGISVANVKVRLHRARNKLREILKAECTFEKDHRGILTCVPQKDGAILKAMKGEKIHHIPIRSNIIKGHMQNKTRKKISFHELDLILRHHRQWLDSGASLGRRAELSGIDLSGRDLFGAILTRATIENVDFYGANLRTANFQEANIRGCRLSQAHIQWSILTGAIVDGCDLTRANLQFTEFSNATLTDVDLGGAFFHNAYLTKAGLQRANLTGANLRFSTWESAVLEQVNLTESTIQLADFSHATLRKTDFHNAQIFNTNFTNAYLSAVILNGAILENVNFQGAHYDPECFQEAYCRGCTFDGGTSPVHMISDMIN